jgi:DNA-binding winged helix-turn-helix (wHTH) protein
MSRTVREQDSSPSVAFHPAAARRAVLFGPFRFDLSDRTLTRDGIEVRLPPRALLILAHLLERPNRIVSKQELVDAVWKDAFVGETSLTEAIGVLRQALGDAASDSTYLQTIHRRGYRFVAPLRVEAQTTPALAAVPLSEQATAEIAPSTAANLRVISSRWIAVAGVALLGAAALVAWSIVRRDNPPQITRATITLPVSQAPAPGLTAQPVATLSPDGRRIVYVAGAPGSYRLFLRAIDQFEAIPIPGTDGAHGAFFSPNGASIGFFARGRLFVLQLPDGQPIDLASAGMGFGGWWHTDDSIVRDGFPRGPLPHPGTRRHAGRHPRRRRRSCHAASSHAPARRPDAAGDALEVQRAPVRGRRDRHRARVAAHDRARRARSRAAGRPDRLLARRRPRRGAACRRGPGSRADFRDHDRADQRGTILHCGQRHVALSPRRAVEARPADGHRHV